MEGGKIKSYQSWKRGLQYIQLPMDRQFWTASVCFQKIPVKFNVLLLKSESIFCRSYFLWSHVGSHSKDLKERHRWSKPLCTWEFCSKKWSLLTSVREMPFQGCSLSGQGCQIPCALSAHAQLPTTASPKNQPEQQRKSPGIKILRKPTVTQFTVLVDPLWQ